MVSIEFPLSATECIKYQDLLECSIICDKEGEELIEFNEDIQIIAIVNNEFVMGEIKACTIDYTNNIDLELIKMNTIRELAVYEKAIYDEITIWQINNMFLNTYFTKDKQNYYMDIPLNITETYISMYDSDNADCENVFDKQLIIDTYTALDPDFTEDKTYLIDPLLYFKSRHDTKELKKDINEMYNDIKVAEKELTEYRLNECKINIPILKDSCPICFEPFYKLTNNLITLSCGHTFCDCIKKCFNCLCPTCRKPFNMNSIGYNIALKQILELDNYVVKYKKIVDLENEIKELQNNINLMTNLYEFKLKFINDDTFNKLNKAINLVYGDSIKISEIQLNNSDKQDK